MIGHLREALRPTHDEASLDEIEQLAPGELSVEGIDRRSFGQNRRESEGGVYTTGRDSKGGLYTIGRESKGGVCTIGHESEGGVYTIGREYTHE